MKNLFTTSIGHLIIVAILIGLYALIGYAIANDDKGYAMVVSYSDIPIDTWEYIGHFSNCEQAGEYADINHDGYVSSRCLLDEYMILPADLEIIDRRKD